MPAKPASDALKRFTVLDLTRVRAGPTCVRQLAGPGANVKNRVTEARKWKWTLAPGMVPISTAQKQRAMTLNRNKGVDLQR